MNIQIPSWIQKRKEMWLTGNIMSSSQVSFLIENLMMI